MAFQPIKGYFMLRGEGIMLIVIYNHTKTQEQNKTK